MNIEMLETLQKARLLVEQSWCQLNFAQDKDGNGVEPFDPRACCFCLEGALEKSVGINIIEDGEDESYTTLYKIVLDKINTHWPEGHFEMLSQFNDRDSTTKDKVLLVLDETIQDLEGDC